MINIFPHRRTIMSVSDDMMNVHNYDTGLPIEKVACKTRIEGRMSIKNVDKTRYCVLVYYTLENNYFCKRYVNTYYDSV